VIGFFTLHHLHDLFRSFKAMALLLKPGGRLAFLEPNPLNPLYHIQIAITPGMSYRGECSLFQMRKKIIFPLLKEAGYVNITSATLGFFPPFLTNKSWGRKMESQLERFPLWQKILPFRIFKGELP